MNDDIDFNLDFFDDILPTKEPENPISESSIDPETFPKRRKFDSEDAESTVLFSPRKNSQPEDSEPNQKKARLNKILQICNRKPQNSSSIQNSKSPEKETQNEMEISSRENSRTNFINSILNQSSKKSLDIEEIAENPPKKSRQNLINSILKSNRAKNADVSEEGNSTRKSKDGQKTRRSVSFLQDENTQNDSRIHFQNDFRPGIDHGDDLNDRDDSGFDNNLENQSIWRKNPRKSNLRFRDDSSRKDETGNSSRSRNESRSRQVIVRKFAGPAGLLPAGFNANSSSTSIINRYNESENEKRINDSRISNFCSQNTKNLFTSGSWQLMMDDLPVDFLLGQDIVTIKRNAKNGQYKMKRTNFVAAMIHHVDSINIVNRNIILKDCTDQIEANVHRNLFFMYPNSIEIGSAILLKELTIIYSKRYCIALISPGDVVAIYNEKARIVTTDAMEKIIKDQERNDLRETLVENSNLESFGSIKGTLERREEKEDENPDQPDPKISTMDIFNKSRSLSGPTPILTPTQILDNEPEEEFLNHLDLDDIGASQGPQNIASSTLIGTQFSSENLGRERISPVENSRDLGQKSRTNSSKLQSILKQFRHKEELTQPEISPEVTSEIQVREEAIPTTSNFAHLLDSEDENNPEMATSDYVSGNNSALGEKEKSKRNDLLKSFRHKRDLSQGENNAENKLKRQEKNLPIPKFTDLLSNSDDDIDLDENVFSDRDTVQNINENDNRQMETNKQRNSTFSEFDFPDDEIEIAMSQISCD